MKFATNIQKEKYEDFVRNHPTKSHFLQSYAWGEFCKKSKNLIPYYIGLENDNNELVAATLLLQKKLPLGYSYFYAPRGFVIDFYDDNLLKEFVSNIKNFVSKYKSIFIKIDPDIIWKEYDYKNCEINLDKDPTIVFNNLKTLGFKHLGFTKNFETMQPRYTFRINMNQSFEEIKNKFSKTTNQRINKAISLNTNVRIGNYDDINTFSHLMNLTETRKDFVSHNLEYYQSLYQIYNKDNKMDLFIGSVDIDSIIKDYKKELNNDKSELLKLNKNTNPSKTINNRKKELNKNIESLESLISEDNSILKEYGPKIDLNAHVIMEYGNKAWVLYAGNHNILTSTYSNYKTYFEHIKYCYDNNIKIYDQFGTIGDLSKDNPRLGLHEFKKKFGGDYIEFIGEFDLITNKFMYFVFNKLVPLYRNIIIKIAKKRRR